MSHPTFISRRKSVAKAIVVLISCVEATSGDESNAFVKLRGKKGTTCLFFLHAV